MYPTLPLPVHSADLEGPPEKKNGNLTFPLALRGLHYSEGWGTFIPRGWVLQVIGVGRDMYQPCAGTPQPATPTPSEGIRKGPDEDPHPTFDCKGRYCLGYFHERSTSWGRIGWGSGLMCTPSDTQDQNEYTPTHVI
eukprot:764958-Hanusia_phi.AAC.3